MANFERKVMEFLDVPVDREELETLYFERSAELLQLKAFLKEKELIEEYEMSIAIAKSTVGK